MSVHIHRVRLMIENVVQKEKDIWQTFLRHSRECMSALCIGLVDLEIIQRGIQEHSSMYPDIAELGAKGFLKVTVEDEQFAFAIKNVCGAPYGGGWQNCVVVICTSNALLNNSVGYGTTLIIVVSDEWQKKIIDHLKHATDDGPDAVVGGFFH